MRLTFKPKPTGQKKHWRENLSAVAAHGATLFAADDENPAICRLIAEGDGYRHVGMTKLADLVADLPGGTDGEMDVEGLAVEGGHLWIVGSHAPARKQPKEGDDDARALARLVEVRDDPNRHFLGRLSVIEPTGGSPADLGAGAHLPMRPGEGRLLDLLEDDPYLGRFVGIPAKENGLAGPEKLARWSAGPLMSRAWVARRTAHKAREACEVDDGQPCGRRVRGALPRTRNPLFVWEALEICQRDAPLPGSDLRLLLGSPLAVCAWATGMERRST